MYLVVFSYFGEFPKIALQIVLLTQEDYYFFLQVQFMTSFEHQKNSAPPPPSTRGVNSCQLYLWLY